MRSKFRSLVFRVTGILIICIAASCEKEPINKLPTVDAGSSATIQLPVDSLIVSGSASDEDGQIIAYLWSQVSGGNSVTIQNPGSVSTTITGFRPGLYLFQLMVVDDKGATGRDTVSVIVKPALTVLLTLQPARNTNEVHVWGNTTNKEGSHHGAPELGASSWTHDGYFVNQRGLFRFDLSGIPAGATIVSAKLTLFSNPTPNNGDLINANSGPDNAMLIQRVTSPWTASTVRWNMQPTTTASEQIVIPHTNQSTLDLVDLDVTNLVQSMRNANYGFMIKLQTETVYNSRLFASSFHSMASKHPKLVVLYAN